ncbi:MAG: class I SAM-dependent methyltransferase, partial [Terriglobales bacterium]
MQLKTNSEWLEWGRRDPLFGVSTWEGKNVDGAAPWTNAEFYALGASDWKDFNERWRKYGYTAGTFVEVGCGAGRITRQLASVFNHGHALDVSKDMIAYASKNVVPGNVEWHVTEGLTIPLEDNSVDAAFSCHVLQHLPNTDAGYAYFREVFRTLRPGGTLMIHLPIHTFPTAANGKFGRLCDFLYNGVQRALDLKLGYQRLRMRLGSKPPMRGISFDLGKLHRT